MDNDYQHDDLLCKNSKAIKGCSYDNFFLRQQQRTSSTSGLWSDLYVGLSNLLIGKAFHRQYLFSPLFG
jgi:hypothetical protein